MEPPLSPLDAARADWLAGNRDAWSLYTLCVAQLRAIHPAAPPRPPLRPRPSLPVDRPAPRPWPVP